MKLACYELVPPPPPPLTEPPYHRLTLIDFEAVCGAHLIPPDLALENEAIEHALYNQKGDALSVINMLLAQEF